MTLKKRKKDKNAAYCQKVKLRRLQLRNFDKKYRKKEAIRKASYRAKRQQQQRTEAHKITNRPTHFFKNFPSRNDI